MRFLMLFLGLWSGVFVAYLFYPFSRYSLLKEGMSFWLFYIIIHLIAVSIGFINLYLCYFRALSRRGHSSQRIVMFKIKILRRYYMGLLLVGGLFTFVKTAIVVHHFGSPSSLHYLYTVRIAYLQGGLYFPAVVEFFSRYPLLSASVLAAFIYWVEGKLWPAMCTLLFLTVNNLSFGSRGDIVLSMILYMATLLVLAYVSNNSIANILLNRRLLFLMISVLAIVIVVFIGRHGYNVRNAIDDSILYFAGNIPATVYVLHMAYDEQLSPMGPIMSIGGILRFATELLKDLGISMPVLPVDFGYVPVYSDLDYGVNTYTYVAYLVGDWGLVGSLIASYLIGFIVAYSLIRAKAGGSVFWLVTSIIMVTLLLTTPLYLASKLISWWMTWLVSYLVSAGCVSVEKTLEKGYNPIRAGKELTSRA